MNEKQRQEFEEYKRSILESPTDRLYRSGEWELRIVYKARGSKSEGPHGVLYKDGEIVEPLHVGEVISTDLGMLKYYSHLEETRPSWEITGWNFADQTLILPSWVKEEKTASSK